MNGCSPKRNFSRSTANISAMMPIFQYFLPAGPLVGLGKSRTISKSKNDSGRGLRTGTLIDVGTTDQSTKHRLRNCCPVLSASELNIFKFSKVGCSHLRRLRKAGVPRLTGVAGSQSESCTTIQQLKNRLGTASH